MITPLVGCAQRNTFALSPVLVVVERHLCVVVAKHCVGLGHHFESIRCNGRSILAFNNGHRPDSSSLRQCQRLRINRAVSIRLRTVRRIVNLSIERALDIYRIEFLRKCRLRTLPVQHHLKLHVVEIIVVGFRKAVEGKGNRTHGLLVRRFLWKHFTLVGIMLPFGGECHMVFVEHKAIDIYRWLGMRLHIDLSLLVSTIVERHADAGTFADGLVQTEPELVVIHFFLLSRCLNLYSAATVHTHTVGNGYSVGHSTLQIIPIPVANVVLPLHITVLNQVNDNDISRSIHICKISWRLAIRTSVNTSVGIIYMVRIEMSACATDKA